MPYVMKRFIVLRVMLAVVVLLAPRLTPLNAAVTWQFNLVDPPGIGFNDAALGNARQQAMNESAAIVSSLLSAYSATIVMDVDGSDTGDDTLAAAGSNENSPLGSGFGNRGDVGLKILGEADPDLNGADGTISWNFQDHLWDLDDEIEPNQFDFKSTMIHELFHAVGFISNISEFGQDLGGTPANTEDAAWGPYDQFVGDSIGPLIDPATFALGGARWNAASIGGSGDTGLLFHGPNAKAANGGNAVALYSPAIFEEGSSGGSHLDDQFFMGQQAMESATAEGMGIRPSAPSSWAS